MMMLLLTSTLLFINNNINDADDANDIDDVNNVNNVNDANDADVNDADHERRRRSSIEEEKESRLDTSLDRVERLVVCCCQTPSKSGHEAIICGSRLKKSSLRRKVKKREKSPT
jgi:hypothetical protein